MAFIKKLSDQMKGIALIITGVILILHKLGILRQGLDFYIVIVIAAYLIIAGIAKLEGKKNVQEFFDKE